MLNKFIIKRTDLAVDEVTLESEGLTLGRLVGNDLLLNHPTVSRTHAGIKEISGEFWIFNLSSANRTILNGELIDKVPLVDGDVLQIGPYFLRIEYIEICSNCGVNFEETSAPSGEEQDQDICTSCGAIRVPGQPFCTNCGKPFQPPEHCPTCGTALLEGRKFCIQCGTRVAETGISRKPVWIKNCKACGKPRSKPPRFALLVSVEMEIATRAVGIEDAQAATILFGASLRPGKSVQTRAGVSRVAGTALLTKFLPPADEQALRLFWDKRKREAGKVESEFRLAPQSNQKIGKSQFTWRPSFDLRRLWRKSYIAWGVLVASSFSLLGLIIYPQIYSPGAVSKPHTLTTMSASGVALRANANSCFSCHHFSTMQKTCTSCHTTSIFDPSMSRAHMDANISCIGCHTEHRGADFRPAFAGTILCISCHNDRYLYRGKALGTPHGGSVGYPVVEGKWVWEGISEERWRAKRLPGNPSDYSKMNQFHLLHFHLAGMGTGSEVYTKCIDCHETGDRISARFKEAPRYSCAACHATSFGTGTALAVGPNCASCHQQHGRFKNLIASPRKLLPDGSFGPSGGQPIQASVQNIPAFGKGGAETIRQDQSALGFISFLKNFGALTSFGWTLLLSIIPVIGFIAIFTDTFRRRSRLRTATVILKQQEEIEQSVGRSIDLAKIQAEGPKYPYPVVDPLLCIGCHACVEACPHDVLAIVNGIATPVAPDSCMEDTGCEAECPTQPKACIVLNRTKVIPARKVPKRDQRYLTNVQGVYIIGDVSGVPLIKMAMNEGAKVMEFIAEDLQNEPPNSTAEYDVAIIGVGPGGLSATAMAKQKGLKYVALEQENVVSTIQAYPAGKYVFFKPDSVDSRGLVPLAGVGDKKENILDSWMQTIEKYRLKIHEEERCKSIQKENGVLVVTTEKGKAAEVRTYKARKVVVAVGNRGAPMKLGVPGEERTRLVEAYNPEGNRCQKCGTICPTEAEFCTNCGTKMDRRGGAQLPKGPKECPNCGRSFSEGQSMEISVGPKIITFSCRSCGAIVQRFPTESYEDNHVKYKLTNPDDYANQKVIVVGGGNSAIEAAVDLCGFKREDEKIKFTRTNEVTLIVRSDFKGDLKLGNKINLYDCMDAGKVKVLFGAAIKEITEKEVVVINVRSKEEIARLQNDYVFALIGGEKPTKFLEGIGIKIG
jgi:thioredoxin reductase